MQPYSTLQCDPLQCVCTITPPTLTFEFVLSVAAAQRPSVSDSMLTTLRKAPKKRLGLAVSFPISHRCRRSCTQLMANNYPGKFPTTASGGFIRWNWSATSNQYFAPLTIFISYWHVEKYVLIDLCYVHHWQNKVEFWPWFRDRVGGSYRA